MKNGCIIYKNVFPECVARVSVSLWGSGGWGCVRSTLPSRSQPSATVRNRPQPSATVRVRTVWPCLWEVLQEGSFLEVSDVWLLRFAWQISCQAQHFRRVHRHFSWQAQHFRRVVLRVFCKIALAGLRQVATRCKFRGSHGILCDVLKIDGSLARNIDFEVANFHVLRKTRRTTSILKLQSVKIGGSLARNARFGASACLVSRHWFYGCFAVSMGEAAKHVSLACFKVWKLEEVSHEMLVLVLPRVSSRVSGFPVVSPCLCGKPQNLSPFRRFPRRLSCRFALQAWHFVTFQPV